MAIFQVLINIAFVMLAVHTIDLLVKNYHGSDLIELAVLLDKINAKLSENMIGLLTRIRRQNTLQMFILVVVSKVM